MKRINFILKECTSLRYFMPLVEECLKNNIQSNFFVGKSNKYNCPYVEKNKKELLKLSNIYKINLYDLYTEKINNKHSPVTIITEGVGIEHLNKDLLNISMSSMTDFTISYKNYVDYVDYVLLPSRFMAEYYHDMEVYPIDNSPAGGTLTDKNIYFGSTKYDVDLSRFSYSSKKNKSIKKIVIFAPNSNDTQSYSVFSKILNAFSTQKDYQITVKSRGKHIVPPSLRGDVYHEDTHWFPHTSLVLLDESDMAIMFGSTVTKECIMLNKPYINVDLKVFKHLKFLKSKCCIRYESEKEINYDSLKATCDNLIAGEWQNSFNDIRERYLFKKDVNVSSKLLKFCIENIKK